jgi:acyl-CoA reductase-like NAD-dependent aldehyde dehydrogenase
MEATTKAAATDAPSVSTDGAGQFEVNNPADGTVIRTLPTATPAEVAETVARVRAAQPEWEAMGFKGRNMWLGRFRDWMFANHDRIADVMQAESGKVRGEAELEVPYVCNAINFYGKHGPSYIAEEKPKPHILPLRIKRLRVVYRPYQVAGVISPWNFPLILSMGDAIPALVAGCAVVIKPSEHTPLCLMEIARGWKEIGAPDVFDVVNGVGETGGALVDECDVVQFTGSDRTGKLVMKRAADTLTPISLELGGKDPMVVLRDAPLERAVNAAAAGGLINTGQICMSIERVYVEEPIYDEFVSRLAEKVKKLRQGVDGRSFGADIGAMTAPIQIGIVEEHVEDARAKGARVLTGGKRKEGPGDWYEPTVLADVDHSMKVMTDETFGPVIPVMKVSDADEAVRMANDSRYGLAASVFAKTARKGEEIARRIDAGAVNVNDVLTNYLCLSVPMGGWKQSGIGFRHGSYGIRKFVRPESIVSPRMKQGKADPLWFPYTKSKRRLIRRAFRLVDGRGLRDRLGR